MAPHFKKLTDCPENLREAIDWLIQVRHGNGEKGLGELAKALKQLVEESIDNAYTTNVGALLKLFAAAKPYTCCKDKVAKIENLKDSKNPEKENFNDIKTNSENIKNCSKNHLDPSQQKSYDEIDSKLDQLKNLKESLKGITVEKNCKELLTNLCDGLETFLGFNSATKGYDGQGIVYSDLDRLCDAVMAFLHGVLESVKDDESVKHYDDNVSKNKQNISRACQHLSQNLHAGRPGFRNSIEHVQDGIEGYLDQMKSLSDTIVGDLPKGTLNTLEKQIDYNARRIQELLSNQKPFEENVGKWYKTVIGDLPKTMESAVLAMKQLDKPLRKKLNNDFEKIRTEVQHLKTLTKKEGDELNYLRKNIDKVFDGLEDSVYRNVEEKMNEMQSTLIKSVKNIRSQVRAINEQLEHYVKELGEWIAAAEKILQDALVKIETILKGVKDKYDNIEDTLITVKATEMKNKADKLHDAYIQAKEAVKVQAQQAVKGIEGFEGVYKEKLNSMKTNIDAAVHQATEALNNLKNTLDSGLDNLRTEHLDKAIQGIIKVLEKGIRHAVRDATGAPNLIQEFNIGLEGRDSAPTLHGWSEKAIHNGGLRGALDAFHTDGRDFDKFKDILTQLSEDQNQKGTFYTALIQEIQNKIQEAINKVKSRTSQFKAVFHAFHTQITGAPSGDDETVHKKIQTIQNQFETDDFENIEGRWLIKESSMAQLGIKRGALSGAINDVNNGFSEADASIRDIRKDDTFQTLLTDITNELQRIAGVVSKEADTDKGVKEMLQQLQNDIGKSVTNGKLTDGLKSKLEEIKKNFHNLQTRNVVNLYTAVETFQTQTLPDLVGKCKKSILVHLDGQVDKSKKAIKTDALSRYVKSKFNELVELYKFVGKQRIALEKIIDIDTSSGSKGFLNNLSLSLHHFSTLYMQDTVSEAASSVSVFFQRFLEDVRSQPDMDPVEPMVDTLGGPLHILLTAIAASKHFDKVFTDYLRSLRDAMLSLRPQRFGASPCGIVDVLKEGIRALAGELQKAYISTYSMHVPKDANHTKYAKVLLTIVTILHSNISTLSRKCNNEDGAWKNYSVNLSKVDEQYVESNKPNQITNPLGKCFELLGYAVSDSSTAQNGELRNNISGLKIYNDIFITSNGILHKVYKGPIVDFNRRLQDYYTLSHLAVPQSPQYPCTVRDMLSWISGLRYNTVYNKVKTHCGKFLEKKSNDRDFGNKDDPIFKECVDKVAIDLEVVSHECGNILFTICGNGRGFDRADYTYGCDFLDNSRGFHYPADAPGLFDMLKEVCQRLLRSLRFLYIQCQYTAIQGNGWANCVYGNGVKGHELSCTNSSNSDAKSDYQPYSSLQRYLMDGLPGFLPHKLTSVGCRSECSTCSTNKPSQHCITPMGFWDLPEAGSKVGTGEDICGALAELCRDASSPLCSLLHSLQTIMPYPPNSLGDMFMLFCHLLRQYNGTYSDNAAFRKQLDVKIIPACLPLPYPEVMHNDYQAYTLTEALTALYHSPDDHFTSGNMKNKSDLWSLCNNFHNNLDMKCAVTDDSCVPFLQPLCHDANHTYAPKHAALYLTWTIHLAFDFHELLKSLYESFCEIDCKISGCSSCNCLSGKHAVSETWAEATGPPKSGCHCRSIVQCRGVQPMLFKYGFTFGNAARLNHATKKSCSDFLRQLEKVIESRHFTHLFGVIDKLLFAIRAPFIWMNVALWLLSLLYLTHIMVIRLDLLHIKSHLHSPSSHRIAAQSLLAAARVGRLSKISYLQP